MTDESGKSPFVICLECLRHGKTSEDFPGHKADHDYYVFDNLEFPLLTDDWTAFEEIRLIQGIMKCGLGNWQEIAESYVKGSSTATAKTPEQCETHYYGVLMKQEEEIEY